MKESSSTLCMSLSASVEDFFLKSLEDLDEPGLTSCLTSPTECISMLFWYLSVLLLRGRISSPLAALGASCLALYILLLGVMKRSRLRETSEGLPREGSFLALMENSRQLSSMSRGGAGSMAESFLRSVEAALRFMLSEGSLILFTTFEDCILQLVIQANAAHLFRRVVQMGRKMFLRRGLERWMYKKYSNFDMDQCLPKRSKHISEKTGINVPHFYVHSKLLNDLINQASIIQSFPLILIRAMTENRPHPLSKAKPTNSSPIYHERPQLRKNQVGVHVLYQEILKEFVRRLAQPRNQEMSLFSGEEQLRRFEAAIKYYYNHAMAAYPQALRKRQSGKAVLWAKQEKLEEEQANNDKYEYIEELDEEFLDEEESVLLPPKAVVPNQPHTQIPNLFAYKPLADLKLQTHISHPSPNSAKHEDQTSSDSDSDTENMAQYASSAERRTNCLLFGNFVNSKIKRKPKEEKMMVELHNIFAKFAHNGRDAFFDRGTVELRKIEKSQVPL